MAPARTHRAVVVVALVSLGAATAAAAQSQAVFRTGVSVGAAQLTDVRSERAVAATLEYDPISWLSLAATPTLLNVSDQVSGSPASSAGLGDLPLAAGAWQRLRTAWSPVVGGGLVLTLPVGNAACGLGSGTTGVAADLGLGVTPAERIHASVSASRGLAGLAAQSALSAPRTTSLRAEAALDLSSRVTATAALGVDVGSVDSTQAPSRAVGAGATYAISSLLHLTIDGIHGLTDGAPRWALAIGIGTASAGVSPVSPASPLRRLSSTFVGSANRGSGAGKIGGCR